MRNFHVEIFDVTFKRQSRRRQETLAAVFVSGILIINKDDQSRDQIFDAVLETAKW